MTRFLGIAQTAGVVVRYLAVNAPGPDLHGDTGWRWRPVRPGADRLYFGGLALVIGGLFFIIDDGTSSRSAVQATHKRVFRMAPLHHHFEFKGWKVTIIVRFWIVAILFAVTGFVIFYAEWVSHLLPVGGIEPWASCCRRHRMRRRIPGRAAMEALVSRGATP